jgi:FkbM family methyltransferase
LQSGVFGGLSKDRSTPGMHLWRAVKAQLLDVGTFGPSILWRYFIPADARGAVSIGTRVGRISLRPADSDMSVLREVFVRRVFDLNRFAQGQRVKQAYDAILDGGRTPVIIDAGANIGAASIWFSNVFPAARILAVEPDPTSAALCRLNCEPYRNVLVCEAAIGSVAGKVSLVRPNTMSWAVQSVRNESAEIRVLSVDDLLKIAGGASKLFIMKIDIEGFERDLFASQTSWLAEPTVVIVETHDRFFPGQYSSLTFQKAIFAHRFELLISGDNLIFVR